jgi:serine protease AprX
MNRSAVNRSSGKADRKSVWGSIRACAAFAPIILLIVALTAAPAAGAGNGKGRLAPDLAEKLKNGSPSDKLRLVVSTLKGANFEAVVDQVRALGFEVSGEFKNVRQLVMELPIEAVESLAGVEGIDYIAPDRPVQGLASHIQTTTGASKVYPSELGGSLLSSLTSSLLGASGFDGTGIGIAILDSGVDPDRPDLTERTTGQKRVVLSIDFTGGSGSADDPYGHGTHVAGIAAGNGAASRLVGRDYAGIAPAAKLINLRVLDKNGRGYVSKVIAAIDYAIAVRPLYNIKVLNLSLSAPPVESYVDDPLCRAAQRAASAGLVVVAAAGNFGVDSTGRKVYGGIASPGNSPAVITVGATDTFGTDVRSDDRIAPYSSRGPTMSRSIDPVTGAVTYDNLAKPDVVAPGFRIVSLERYQNTIVTAYPMLHVDTGSVNNKSRYMFLSGTSMSTGVVSGAVALMMQANPSLTPNMVKAILMYSAQIMNGADLFEQGAGMVNIDGAVRLARSLRKDAKSVAPGTTLTFLGLPAPQSTVSGETFAWSQSLIWGFRLVCGDALLSVQQEAYAQGLIWGFLREVFGAGVTMSDGLYSDQHVVFGQNGQWAYVTWDQGTTLGSGMVWRDDLYASGVYWGNDKISEAFFSLNSSALIWGFGDRTASDLALIWGFGDRYAYDMGLIWGILLGLGGLW